VLNGEGENKGVRVKAVTSSAHGAPSVQLYSEKPKRASIILQTLNSTE